jgi:hypothetical protein
MPLRLLWQPRHARDIDVPILLEIIEVDTRWDQDEAKKRWEAGPADKRWTTLPAFSRWVILEIRRFVWRKEGREDKKWK